MTTVKSESDDRVVNNTNTVRHNYRILTDDEKKNMVRVKLMGSDFLDLVDTLGTSRELSLAKTRIEEAVMWAVKDITK